MTREAMLYPYNTFQVTRTLLSNTSLSKPNCKPLPDAVMMTVLFATVANGRQHARCSYLLLDIKVTTSGMLPPNCCSSNGECHHYWKAKGFAAHQTFIVPYPQMS